MKLIYHTCCFSFYRVDNVASRVQPAPTICSQLTEALAVKSPKCTVSPQEHHHVNCEDQVGPVPRRH